MNSYPSSRNTCKVIIRELKAVCIPYWTIFLAPIIFYIAKKTKTKIKFNKGLELTIKWYLDHQDWLDNVISKEYLKYYEKLYGNR